jgi:Raf kinase inhibitor-like YbhB/YbcL family protein
MVEQKRSVPMSLELRSAAFTHQGVIPALYTCDGEGCSPAPALYTCDGEDRSPALSWSGTPTGTKSLVLIMEETDAANAAPARTVWVHWILYNLPPHATGLCEAVKSQGLPAGTHEGLNCWRHARYDGPCSPVERRHYVFELYALGIVLPDLNRPTNAELQRKMQGHILQRATLAGHYQRRW